MPSLTVDLNHGGPRTVAAPDEFLATGPFDVVLRNHGAGAHVHLRIDEGLASVARTDEGNAFVGAGESASVRVETKPVTEPVTGRLEVGVGYGAESEAVDVTVAPAEENGDGVRVDESLGRVERGEPDLLQRFDPTLRTLAVVALAAVALGVALWAGLVIESAVVLAGVAVVVVGVAAALVQLAR